MTADLQTFGFPAGYFIIRSVATKRMWDVEADEIEDGTGAFPPTPTTSLLADSDNEEIVLWPEKEKSLVEGISCDI